MWDLLVISSSRISNKDADLCQKLHKMLSIFAINQYQYHYLQSYFILECLKARIWKTKANVSPTLPFLWLHTMQPANIIIFYNIISKLANWFFVVIVIISLCCNHFKIKALCLKVECHKKTCGIQAMMMMSVLMRKGSPCKCVCMNCVAELQLCLCGQWAGGLWGCVPEVRLSLAIFNWWNHGNTIYNVESSHRNILINKTG